MRHMPVQHQNLEIVDHHQPGDRAEEQHIGQRDHQVDLPQRLQLREQGNPDDAADGAPQQHDDAQLEIDIAPPPMGQHAGDGGGDQLVRLSGDRDRRRNADKDQQRRHQEPAPDSQETR
jgi:hypothetical protein